MKCKSCGANYKTKDLTCPYCGEVNRIGFQWKMEEDAAEANYQRAKKEVAHKTSPHEADQIVNRLIMIMGILLAGICLLFCLEEPIAEREESFKRLQVDEDHLEMLYQTGEYEALYNYMQEYSIYGEDEYEKYTQYVKLNRDMDEFIEMRMDFVQAEPEDFAEFSRTGIAYDAIRTCCDVYQYVMYSYKAVLPEHEAIYGEMCTEVEAFLIGELEMTKEEVELLKAGELMYTDAWDEFYMSIYERKGWEYGE